MSRLPLDGWDSLNYAAAYEQADADTQRVMGEVWNAAVRSVRAQAGRAKAKADPFDTRVRNLLTNIERRRGVPVPARARPAKVASAILLEDGGNIDSIKRRVRESLKRQALV